VPHAVAKSSASSSALLSSVSITHVRAGPDAVMNAAASSIPTTFDVIDNVSKLSPADWLVACAATVLLGSVL
jgi:hypothetical protein